MSPIACAVLNALSGNQTWPACCSSADSRPLSCGIRGDGPKLVRVSTATVPMGKPPSRARPVTTDRPQSVITSMNDPRSKNRASISRGSCGAEVGVNPPGSVDGVELVGAGTERKRRAPAHASASQRKMLETPRTSSDTTRCDTPLAPITRGPPICALDVYTSRPSTLFSADAPVRIRGASWC